MTTVVLDKMPYPESLATPANLSRGQTQKAVRDFYYTPRTKRLTVAFPSPACKTCRKFVRVHGGCPGTPFQGSGLSLAGEQGQSPEKPICHIDHQTGRGQTASYNDEKPAMALPPSPEGY